MSNDFQNMRPPYVRFERRAVEDRTQQLAGGKYGYRDVDIAKVTVPGQKDVADLIALDWLANLDKGAADGRIPTQWAVQFRQAYEYWKNGQELPLNGTPIKGWPPLSPAMQETLIMQGIRTVEDLADLSDEGVRTIGMGGMSFKQKAQAWLAEAKKAGTVAEENITLRRDLEAEKARSDRMERQLTEALARLEALQPSPSPTPQPSPLPTF